MTPARMSFVMFIGCAGYKEPRFRQALFHGNFGAEIVARAASIIAFLAALRLDARGRK